ncbi:UNVERIFIED_CONTAM: hypothetical protein GTU68_004799 [Idotea baltica]|nr:hypothetical protein [Idotea baltica]
MSIVVRRSQRSFL